MKKLKLILLSVFCLFISPIFAVNKIEFAINKIFTKRIDNVIENKIKDKNKICIVKNIIYKKIIAKVKKIQNPKYKKYIPYIIEVSRKKIQNCTVQTIIQNKEHFVAKWQLNTKNPVLHFQIDKRLFSKILKNDKWLKFPKRKTYNINLKRINKITNMIQNTFKVKNKWYLFKRWKYVVFYDFKPEMEERILKKYKWELMWVYYHNRKYYVYVFNYRDIRPLWNIDLEKSIDDNIENLYKDWIFYLSKWKYKRYNRWFLVWWIAEYKNRLVFFNISEKAEFYKLNNEKNLMVFAETTPDTQIATKYDNNYILRKKAYIYDLWDARLYKNIDKKLLWKILYSTFKKMTIYKIRYNFKYMYKLLFFAKRWDGKTLKQLYHYMTKKFRYNKIISQKIQEKIDDDKLTEFIDKRPKLYKLWIIFYAYYKKEVICQSLTELFSFVALFNWQKGDIQTWWINYPHQVSKINNFYYDITNDLYNDSYNHFWITKKQLEQYFKIEDF